MNNTNGKRKSTGKSAEAAVVEAAVVDDERLLEQPNDNPLGLTTATAPAPPPSLSERLELAKKGKLNMDDLKKLRNDALKENKIEVLYDVSEIIDKQNRALAAENAQLAAKIEASQFLNLKQMKHVYYEDDGVRRRHPFLRLNKMVEPSVKGHKRQGVNQIEPTQIFDYSTKNLWGNPTNIPIPFFFRTSQGPKYFIPSKFKPQTKLDPLCYKNEIHVQIAVGQLVEDAISCLGLTDFLEHSMEISFYGCTPDIIVVTKNNTVILAIEVKAPDRPGKDDDVCSHEMVAGQIWLYLMAMKQMGIAHPLGAICTFNKIRLVSLEDLDDNGAEATRVAREKLMAISGNGNCVMKEEIEEKPPTKKSVSSPIRTTKPLSETNKRLKRGESFQQDPPDCVHEGKIDGLGVEFKRRVFMGPVQDDVGVLPTLMHAIRVAYDECKEVDNTTILTVDHEVDLGGRIFPFFSKDSIGFLRTPRTFVVNAEKTPRADAEHFLLLDSIGKGSRGEVYLVCTQGRILATIKVYAYKRSFLATQDQRDKENQESLDGIAKQAQEEESKWNLFYEKHKARCVTVNGSTALLMPYGQQLTSVEDRRQNLGKIEEELTRFAEKGYAYDTDEQGGDLRWRHCLKVGNDVVIVDLGSLILHDEADAPKLVEEQMKSLEARIGE